MLLMSVSVCGSAFWMEWVKGIAFECSGWWHAYPEAGGEGVAFTKLTRSGILKEEEKCLIKGMHRTFQVLGYLRGVELSLRGKFSENLRLVPFLEWFGVRTASVCKFLSK